MTWAVALPGLMVGGIVADSQVTHRRGGILTYQEKFGVLKIHQISPYGVLAFAGEITSGFSAIDYFAAMAEQQYDGHGPESPPMYVDGQPSYLTRVVQKFTEIFVPGENLPLFGDVSLLVMLSEGPRRHPVADPTVLDYPEQAPTLMLIQTVKIDIDIDRSVSVSEIKGRPGDPLSIGTGAEIEAIVHAFSVSSNDGNFLLRDRLHPHAGPRLTNAFETAIRSVDVQADPRRRTVNDRVYGGLVSDEGVSIGYTKVIGRPSRPLAKNRSEWNKMMEKWGPQDSDSRSFA